MNTPLVEPSCRYVTWGLNCRGNEHCRGTAPSLFVDSQTHLVFASLLPTESVARTVWKKASLLIGVVRREWLPLERVVAFLVSLTCSKSRRLRRVFGSGGGVAIKEGRAPPLFLLFSLQANSRPVFTLLRARPAKLRNRCRLVSRFFDCWPGPSQAAC